MWKKNKKYIINYVIIVILCVPSLALSQIWTESTIDSFKTGIGVDSTNVDFYFDDMDDGSIMLSPASENFAFGKQAEDNDSYDQNDPNLVLDGKIQSPSFWASYTPFCVGTWITIDLEATRTVERVNILGSDFEPHLKYIKGNSIDLSLDNSNWTRVANNPDNTEWDVYESFEPTTARYVRVTIEKSDNINWTFIGEIQVFGSGFASSGTYISKVKDFGGPVNFGKAHWDATVPAETKLTLQFRSDSTNIVGETQVIEDTLYLNNAPAMAGSEKVTNLDGNVTYVRNLDYFINYESGEIVRSEGSSILVGQEIMINYQAWSQWTEESAASEGLLFSTLEPRRYLQYKINFATFSLETPVFKEISIEYDNNPVVERAVTSVSPTEVPVLKESQITYIIEINSSERDLGIDTLKIMSPAAAKVTDSRIDGNALNYQDLTDPLKREVVIYFPDGVPASQSSILEIDLTTTLFESENFFPGQLISEQAATNPQYLEQSIDGWRVLTTGIPESPLVSVEVKPNPMTPNGDNICDFSEFTFFVAKIAELRKLKINIYNLDGDLVCNLLDVYTGARDFRVKWDGKNNWGQLVIPGVYLAQVSVDTDEGKYTSTKTISVVY